MRIIARRKIETKVTTYIHKLSKHSRAFQLWEIKPEIEFKYIDTFSCFYQNKSRQKLTNMNFDHMTYFDAENERVSA